MIKEYKINDILDKLPNSWSDIKLKHFMEMLQLKLSNDDEFYSYENSISVASIFLDLDIEIIEKFPVQFIAEINGKLKFLNERPEPLKNPKWKPFKNIEDIDYDTFILYIKVSEQISKADFSNFPLIIKKSTKDNIDDVMEMPMDEVETLFFFLRKALTKYLNRSALSLMKKIVKKKLKEKSLTLFKKT